ncbi:hypothetical protein WSM22_18570 [Cytophagales bacterium WSM2-2]|nr:hypothetical protein WSM22_18570 [Cytophagales bacterium WSM2-2]
MERQVDSRLIEKVILRIKKLREDKGVSLQQFYEDTGVHLARIESEKRDIPISTLARICNYFKISLKDFFENVDY